MVNCPLISYLQFTLWNIFFLHISYTNNKCQRKHYIKHRISTCNLSNVFKQGQDKKNIKLPVKPVGCFTYTKFSVKKKKKK